LDSENAVTVPTGGRGIEFVDERRALITEQRGGMR
jgi:hypothetical protein